MVDLDANLIFSVECVVRSCPGLRTENVARACSLQTGICNYLLLIEDSD